MEIYMQTTLVTVCFHNLRNTCHFLQWLLETSFNKNTTYQDRGMRVKKVSKEYENTSENNKRKIIG